MQPVIDVRGAQRRAQLQTRERREQDRRIDAAAERDDDARAVRAGGGPRSSAARTRATSGSACEPSTTSESSQDTRGPRLRKATPAYICRNTP